MLLSINLPLPLYYPVFSRPLFGTIHEKDYSNNKQLGIIKGFVKKMLNEYVIKN